MALIDVKSPKFIKVEGVPQDEESEQRWGKVDGIYIQKAFKRAGTYRGYNSSQHYTYVKEHVDCTDVNKTSDTRGEPQTSVDIRVTKCTGPGDWLYNCNSKDSEETPPAIINRYEVERDADGTPVLMNGKPYWRKTGINKAGQTVHNTIEWMSGGQQGSLVGCPFNNLIMDDDFPGTWIITSSQTPLCCPGWSILHPEVPPRPARGIVYGYEVQGMPTPEYGTNAKCPKNGNWSVPCPGSSNPDDYGNPCLKTYNAPDRVREITIEHHNNMNPGNYDGSDPDLGGDRAFGSKKFDTEGSKGYGLYKGSHFDLDGVETRDQHKIFAIQATHLAMPAGTFSDGRINSKIWFRYGILVEKNWPEVISIPQWPRDDDGNPIRTIPWEDYNNDGTLKEGLSKINQWGWLPAKYEIVSEGEKPTELRFGRCTNIDGMSYNDWIDANRGGVRGFRVNRIVKNINGVSHYVYKKTDIPLKDPDPFRGPGTIKKKHGEPHGALGTSFIYGADDWCILMANDISDEAPILIPTWSIRSSGTPIYYLDSQWNLEADFGGYLTGDTNAAIMKIDIKNGLYSDNTELEQGDGAIHDVMLNAPDPYNATNNYSLCRGTAFGGAPYFYRYWRKPSFIANLTQALPDLPDDLLVVFQVGGQGAGNGINTATIMFEATGEEYSEQQETRRRVSPIGGGNC